MYYWMEGWDWVWMSFVMLFWALVVGVVVYVAVKLADRSHRRPSARP